MRHPPSDKRAAQFMFASPRSAKHVRTSSCAKALARMSYTRGLASFFIVPTPASNSLFNRLSASSVKPSTNSSETNSLESLLSRKQLQPFQRWLVARFGCEADQATRFGAGHCDRSVTGQVIAHEK